MNSSALTVFRQQMYEVWLPSFCNAPDRNYGVEGFKDSSADKLKEHDAYWFLQAVELGIVSEELGFFTAPRSKAKEQIFWQGLRRKVPRPVTLWIEPIITIGALAMLHQKYGWPINSLGAQSATWAFDLVGYGKNMEDELLVCEVKKTVSEIDTLLKLMKQYANQHDLDAILAGKERNAFKKVSGIRRTWPPIFWALGPNEYSLVFKVVRTTGDNFVLEETDSSALHCILS